MTEKWEYQILADVKLGKKYVEILEVINELGKEGWELVDLTGVPTANAGRAVLKRRLP